MESLLAVVMMGLLVVVEWENSRPSVCQTVLFLYCAVMSLDSRSACSSFQ